MSQSSELSHRTLTKQNQQYVELVATMNVNYRYGPEFRFYWCLYQGWSN